MSRFATALLASVIVASFAGTSAFMPLPAEAAKMSKADRVAIKEATVACKAEARGKKIKWTARRKFVNSCVARATKGYPSMDPNQITRQYPNFKGLRPIQPAEWGCPNEC
jgi:hypothetical protein